MVNVYVWSRVLVVCLAGFVFGYDVGSMSGVTGMDDYRQALNLSYHELGGANDTNSCDTEDDPKTAAILGLIVSLLPGGCLVGALTGGVFSDFAGRKPAIVVGGFLVVCGGILHTAAINLWMVLPSRFIGGLGAGLLYQVGPLYVGEISPENARGRMLSFNVVYTILGMLMGTVVNLVVNELGFPFGWRISVGVPIIIGSVLSLGMLLLPRSPRWLAKRHRDSEALKVLCKIYRDPTRAQTQLEEIQQASVSSTREPFIQTLKYIVQWKILQRFLIGFFLFIIGRFTGINFISYFSVIIFCGIGLPGFVVSIALPVVAAISVMLSSILLDKFGRKPVYLVALLVIMVSHLVSASLIVGFDLEGRAPHAMAEVSVSQKVAGYAVLISLSVFFGCVTVSVGNISWITAVELFPLKNRGFMMSLVSSGCWIGMIISNPIAAVLITPPVRISGTLFLFAGVTFLLFLYVLLLLPETKGLTLEKIEELFSKPWSERTNVMYYLRCCSCKELIVKRVQQGRERNYQLLSVPTEQTNSIASPPSEDKVSLVAHEVTNGLDDADGSAYGKESNHEGTDDGVTFV